MTLRVVTVLVLWPMISILSQPSAGRISGRVLVHDRQVAPPRPSVASLGTTTRDPVDRTRTVVYLEAAPRQAFEDLVPGRARMDQRGEHFVPRVLAVTVGTAVEFPNHDETFHNVFSLSPVRTFDLGRYAPGRTGSVTFDRPGIVPIFCDIHTHMSAYVLVFSHPFFAVTDEEGRYTIAGVPPGSYALMVWSEIGTVPPRPIVVRAGGSTQADFEIGRPPS